MALEDIRNERLKKLERLRSSGIDPYPAAARRGQPIGGVLEKFSALARAKKKVAVAGRITAIREHGGSTFVDVRDGDGKLQAYCKEDTLGDAYRLFLETADIGDFAGFEGTLFKTKKGEATLEVKSWTMLAKSLRPLPEKWHGLTDVEERFRKRYLDLVMNEDARSRLVRRSELVVFLRSLFEKEGFLEVETPMLHPIPGGALARPFVTHHNALDADFYLRIAPELYLKRLLAGGFEKVFEVGKNFRNEGIDADHSPEFTMLECYAAYWDEEAMMDFVEKVFSALVKRFGAKAGFEYQGQKIVLGAGAFKRVAFADMLSRFAQVVEYERETKESLATRARQLGIEVGAGESKGKIADAIYKKACRPRLVQPTFVVNHPLDISPLAKARDAKSVRRFQLVVAGMEVMNGFAELNDPVEQRARLEAQEAERKSGEDEAHRIDEEFIEMLEYGMPPAAGLGIGVDRIAMLLTDAKNVREVVLFPTLKPKDGRNEK